MLKRAKASPSSGLEMVDILVVLEERLCNVTCRLCLEMWGSWRYKYILTILAGLYDKVFD